MKNLPFATFILLSLTVPTILDLIFPRYNGLLSTLIKFDLGAFLVTSLLELIALHRGKEI